jgi:acetylornithine deacetylase/succinyl-diaminopimelate desuccinylase-like protein
MKPDEQDLRRTVRTLAEIPRLPTSRGEAEAAEWIRRELADRGCRAVTEREPAYSSYAWPIGAMSAVAVAAAVIGGRGRRAVGTVGGALAALGIADDISGGSMIGRRLLMRPRTTTNVVAETGDPAARRTLCVTVHHDAAPSGFVFDQTIAEWVATYHPEILARMTTNPPLWWPVVAGPALISLGGLVNSPSLRRVGLGLAAGSLAAMVDIGRSPAVPGANDNLSGVAVALALADALRAAPVSGLRVLIVSAGAEEALQEGIRAFIGRHHQSLPADDTWFLNLDTVGSGQLLLLEAEGPIRLRRYHEGFKDLVTGCASAEGVPLLRGMSSRSSTDGSVPARLGYRTAAVVSVDDRRLLPHYHLDSDLPENVDYACVAGAARLTEAVVRALADQPG